LSRAGIVCFCIGRDDRSVFGHSRRYRAARALRFLRNNAASMPSLLRERHSAFIDLPEA